MSLTIPKGITTQPVGKTIIEPWTKVPSNMAVASPAKQLASKLGVPPIIGIPVLAVTVAGLLGGDQARDSQLKKLGLEYDPNTGLSRPIRETNSGNRTTSEPPPFVGGQVSGVMYRVSITDLVSQGPGNTEVFNLQGKIGVPYKEGGNWYLPYQNGSERLNRGGGSYYGIGRDVVGIRINSIVRLDGLPDVSIETPTSTSPSGGVNSDGNPEDFNRSQVKRILPPKFSSTIGWGNTKPIDGRAALGIGSTNIGEGFAVNLAPKPVLPSTTPKTPNVPLKKPSETEKPKTPTPNPLIPQPSEIAKANTKLLEIGAILGTIYANQGTISNNINDIKNNTSTQNLENAAQTGSCRAMNSPSCTKGMEDRIKDPINQKIDAKTGLLAANQAGQDIALGVIAAEQQAQKGVLATIAAKATDIFDLIGRLWNNSLVDKAVGFITMITAFHNAAMLSRSIADTLASAIDSGLVAVGWGIQDKDGNMIGVNQAIGNTIQDLIRKAIGNQAYENLNNTWINANRVYQASINLVSNVQNILDSTTAIAELTSNRVGTLMNALRNAGMVRENAYGAQSQNVTRFNAFMNKLESLEQGTSNVASITGNIVSVQQSVNELKSNRQEFENALKNKPQGSGLPENDPEKQATQTKKAQSIYTIGDFSVVKPPETP